MSNAEPRPAEEDGETLPNNDAAAALEHKARGNELYKSQRYTEAIEEYNKAIELDPSNPRFYGNRSAAHMMQKQYDEVIADCKKAVELDEQFTKAYLRGGKAFACLVRAPRTAPPRPARRGPAHPDNGGFCRAPCRAGRRGGSQGLPDPGPDP